jgi:23S rRNA (guanosine2251-2'-O)-methyltransferase
LIVYGRQAVAEALRGRRAVHRMWATEPARRAVHAGAVPLEVTSPARIEALAGSADHQGVCAETEAYPYGEAADLLSADDALLVALDEVQDPRNLGAVCRVAECAGAAGVVIPERRAVEVTPAVCRASAGAVEHLPVARVRNLAEWLETAKRDGAWVYGAAVEAAVPYERPDYRGRVVLVLGSEGRGLRARVASNCDELVALPVRGRVGSLNVSAAAAALLYGVLHFRAKSP